MKGFKLTFLVGLLVLGSMTLALNQESHSVDLSLVTVIHENVSGSSSDLFGYTVALAQGKRSSSSGWIFIGAPKSNVTIRRPNGATYFEPGSIWRCKVGLKPTLDWNCEMLHFLDQICSDRREKKVGNHRNVHFGTCNSSFMGGSLEFDNGILVACAPTYQRELVKFTQSLGRLRLDGACYWMNEDAALRDKLADELTQDARSSNRGNIIPFQDDHFNNPAQASWNTKTSAIARWYYAGAGASVHVTHKKEVLLGAPLTHTLWGSMLKVEGDSYTKWGLTNLETYSFSPSHFDNFGYAVTSGNYESKNQSLYAASSPRANQQHDKRLFGVVLVLESTTFLPSEKFTDKDKIEAAHKQWSYKYLIWGPSFASYFGASMESVDINGDGLDELIVGAPLAFGSGGLHSSNRINTEDQGCVYIYSAKDSRGFTHPKELCGKAPGGRFGTSIAKLGDLNQDGYYDFAVGAPYEEGGGTVYIYYGSDELDMRELAIKGKKYTPFTQFSSFGCSIAGGVDLDGNGTPDFSVGNYEGKSVAIFRTRPMLRINSCMLSYNQDKSEDLTILDKEETDFILELCVSIQITSNTDTYLTHESNLVIHSRIEIDGKRRRFQIEKRTILHKTITIPRGQSTHCLTLRSKRDATVEQRLQEEEGVPVEYMLWYNETAGKPIQTSIMNINDHERAPQAPAESVPGYANFCPTCPFPMSTETLQLFIPFKNDFKRKNESGSLPVPVDKPDLQITLSGRYGQCTYLNNPLNSSTTYLTFGDSPCVDIILQVQNLNEIAYNPKVRFSWKWNGTGPAPNLKSKDDLCSVQGQIADCSLDSVVTYLGQGYKQDFTLTMAQKDAITSKSKRLAIDVEVYPESDSYSVPINASLSINYFVNASLNPVKGILSNNSFPINDPSTLNYHFKTHISGNSPVMVTLAFLLPESVNWRGKRFKIFQIGMPTYPFDCHEGNRNDSAFDGYQKSDIKGKGEFETLYDRSNCKALECLFEASRDDRYLEIKFGVKLLYTHLARKILRSQGAMKFYGMASATILDLKAEINFTQIIINPPESCACKTDMHNWMVLVAAASSLLFLFLLTWELKKFGFFKRVAKERLKLLKAEADAQRKQGELPAPMKETEEGEGESAKDDNAFSVIS